MKLYNTIIALGTILIVGGCTGMDEYLKISGDKEIVYPGKIADVVAHSGNGRVVIEGYCYSDPKITSCRIYWNLGAEYVELPVDMSSAPFHVEKEIPLEENTYNFDIYTYDAQGNRSIPVNVSSESYGDDYIASLRNRLIKSFSYSGTTGTIEWYNMDTTLGPFESEVSYRTTAGVTATVTVSISETSTTLENYDGSPVRYITRFRPDETCVDVFVSEPVTVAHD